MALSGQSARETGELSTSKHRSIRRPIRRRSWRCNAMGTGLSAFRALLDLLRLLLNLLDLLGLQEGPRALHAVRP